MSKRMQNADEISERNFDARVALRLLPYLRPHLWRMLGSFSLVFLSAGIALYSPRLLGRIVDQAIVPKNTQLLYQLVALFAALEIIRVICIYAQSFRLQATGQAVMQAIRLDLFAKILRMPVAFFDRQPVGRLVTRVTNDTVSLSELFSASFVMLLSDLFLIAGVIIAMLSMHLKLGLAALAVFPVMIYLITSFSERLRMSFREAREVLSRLNGIFAERMQGMPLVQLMERESYERGLFNKVSLEYRDRQADGVYLYSLFHPAITVLTGVSVALVLYFGPGFLERQEIAIGTFVSFLAYVQLLYQPVRSITDRYNIYLAAMASAERIFAMMDMSEEDGLREQRRLGLKMSSVRFENVSFHYPALQDGERRPAALENLSFSLNEGETLAVVGHTGAGKTTLTSLLFRFYEPSSGKIFVGGRDLAEIPKLELRERIGFVQQEVFLFSGTLRENLALMQRGLADAQILEGCARTGFLRVVERLPRGLDTELDERGTNLSLGERQILAFTRVFLQKPDLLVLDEASANVDRESEKLLQKATRELTQGRSAIVIAHRLETVRDADRILVLERGKLVEVGKHAELVGQGGRYARFVQLQEAHTSAL